MGQWTDYLAGRPSWPSAVAAMGRVMVHQVPQ